MGGVLLEQNEYFPADIPLEIPVLPSSEQIHNAADLPPEEIEKITRESRMSYEQRLKIVPDLFRWKSIR